MPAARPSRKPLTARTADKFDLYQRSVQSPEMDVAFMSRLFKRTTGRPLRFLREDFCGTFKICCEFVKRHRENRALGLDLDRETLDWGRRHNLAALTPEQQQRLTLMQRNVLDVQRPPVDLICAMNFSFCTFKTRETLGAYIKNARRSLRPGGLLLMDLYGGGQAQEELTEESRKGGFMYIWDQDKFDPVSHHTLCKIHFAFKDGSRMRNAFVYDWRLWTLPEIQELMVEAGLKDVHVLWEDTDAKTNEGNGNYRRVSRGKADPGWIVYIVSQA